MNPKDFRASTPSGFFVERRRTSTNLNGVRVLVVADDPLARAGLATLLVNQSNCNVVAQVANDGELPNAVQVYRPDVIVLDLGSDSTHMLERASAIRDAGVPVVALLPDDAYANEAWRSGARGILSRSASAANLAAALAAVAQGLAVIDPSFTSSVLSSSRAPSAQLAEELTPRESQVLRLMAEGQSNKEIARALGISDHTVKFHVNAILGKLNVQSRTEAVVQATRLGLILL
jgi:two-component system nitrate/nitrite response regulator NarL